jgi:predicted transcriptional regulator
MSAPELKEVSIYLSESRKAIIRKGKLEIKQGMFRTHEEVKKNTAERLTK